MKLYGVNLSPYTRRVAITLTELGMPFEWDQLRVFDTPEPVRALNPLARVPTLVLDDGSVLIESGAILDEIDQMAGPDKALVPATSPARRSVMQAVGFGTGVMEKSQWAFYERRFHPEDKVHEPWEAHNDAQVLAGLKHLDGLAAAAGDGWLAGMDRMTQADITVAVAYRFAKAVRQNLDVEGTAPALAKFADRMEQRDSFRMSALG